MNRREERLSVFEVESAALMAAPFPCVTVMLVKLHPVIVEAQPLSIFTSDVERLSSAVCSNATPFNSNDPDVARKIG